MENKERNGNGDEELNGMKEKKYRNSHKFVFHHRANWCRKPNPKTDENKKWHRFYSITHALLFMHVNNMKLWLVFHIVEYSIGTRDPILVHLHII